MIRVMTIDDYDEVYALWKKIRGFGIRSIDDSREGVDRFLKRNPTTSVVAVRKTRERLWEVFSAVMTEDGAVSIMYVWMKRIVGTGLGARWWSHAMKALQAEKINKVSAYCIYKE